MEKALIKRAELEEHMSRNINLGMKYKIFWTGTTANSYFMVLRLQRPYGIKFETSYILHLCIVIIVVSQLATFSFLCELLSFSCSLSPSFFQNLITPLHIVSVRIQPGNLHWQTRFLAFLSPSYCQKGKQDTGEGPGHAKVHSHFK